MKLKMKIKIGIDIAMTLLLMFLMGYQFFDGALHEWAGAGMFVLFIAHHILNLNWYKNLFRGKYTLKRIFILLIDMAVFVAMLMLMYSGIVLSREVFAFLPIKGGMMLARRLHMLGTYWGLVLMSLHLGLHWSMFIGMGRKVMKGRMSRFTKIICPVLGAGIAVYGAFAFLHRNLLDYMLLKNEFVFLDFSESKVLFYIDYLAMMGLCIFASHYISKLFTMLGSRKKVNAE